MGWNPWIARSTAVPPLQTTSVRSSPGLPTTEPRGVHFGASKFCLLRMLPLSCVFSVGLLALAVHLRAGRREILIRNTQAREQRIDSRRHCRIDSQRRREQSVTAIVAQRLPLGATIQ